MIFVVFTDFYYLFYMCVFIDICYVQGPGPGATKDEKRKHKEIRCKSLDHLGLMMIISKMNLR